MSRHDGVRVSRALFECRLLKIEAQPRLAHFGIGPMTTKAVGCEDRLDVLIEVEVL
jgi:hypothetical protein